MNRVERLALRLMVAACFASLTAGAVWGPKRLASWVLGVGPPLSGELVPRQIPYRGYLERDGVAVNTPASMAFRLEYGDGGVWNQPAQPVAVSNGNFEVALGDDPMNPIPAAVFADPFVQLSVSVNGTSFAERQRVLTVPFAARALDSWRANSATTATNAQNAANAQLTGRFVVSRNGKSLSIGGLYCGASNPITGNANGYRTLKALCEATCSSPTAHLCSSLEASDSYALDVTLPLGWVANPAESVDLRGGTSFFRDCQGFTTDSTLERGQVWGGTYVGGSVCNFQHPALCCD